MHVLGGFIVSASNDSSTVACLHNDNFFRKVTLYVSITSNFLTIQFEGIFSHVTIVSDKFDGAAVLTVSESNLVSHLPITHVRISEFHTLSYCSSACLIMSLTTASAD